MMRRIFSLLLVLPLLLPQGVCVCDLMKPQCEACAEGNVCVEQVESACSCCCKHKRHQAVENDGPSLTTSHTCAKSGPDKEDRHLPICPIKTGGAQWKSALVSVPILADMAFVGMLPVADVTAAGSFTSAFPVHFDPSDQPLYLTLLNLRI